MNRITVDIFGLTDPKKVSLAPSGKEFVLEIKNLVDDLALLHRQQNSGKSPTQILISGPLWTKLGHESGFEAVKSSGITVLPRFFVDGYKLMVVPGSSGEMNVHEWSQESKGGRQSSVVNPPSESERGFPMGLRILHIEDSSRDAELIQALLREEGMDPIVRRVETYQELQEAFEQGGFDLIFCDYNLPKYDGMSALKLARLRVPNVPFIFVSGTIGEERAIEALKAGATDYVLKGHLKRLGPVVRRALQEGTERAEHRAAEERIREQAALFDIDPSALIVRDIDDRILFWSRGAELLYGLKAQEVIGRSSLELVDRQNIPKYQEAKRIALEKGSWQGEWNYITKDGKELIVDNSWTLVRDEKGNPKSIYVVNSDITEGKKLEAQLWRTQRMDSIGTLAGGIAHDLNNVLGPIILSMQILQKRLTDERSKNLIDMVEASAKRGANMVKQILTFARGEKGEHVNVQPGHLIKEMEEIVKRTFPKSIKMRTDVPNDLWTVSADATGLHQVLLNLCVNARDAMPNGGTLTMKVENKLIDEQYARVHPDAKPGPFVVFSVSDTGTGIPPDVLDRIFEPFFSTKELGKGTGLGLSTVIGITKSHDGFVSVYTEMGKGTQFIVHFPALPSSETARAEREKAELPEGNGETVLVIDDESSIREITRSTLEMFNYNVLTADDGAEGTTIYAKLKDRVDVVVCDVAMPFMDGPATILALRKINPKVKVVQVSGFADNENLTHTGVGQIPFLQKPYTAEQLLKIIALLVRKSGE